jgi:hypothetical protein
LHFNSVSIVLLCILMPGARLGCPWSTNIVSPSSWLSLPAKGISLGLLEQAQACSNRLFLSSTLSLLLYHTCHHYYITTTAAAATTTTTTATS